MAEKKVIEIDIESNLGSLKSQLREAQAEVAKLADKFGATSREATEAAKKAADLKDRIGDAKALTDAFNPDAKFNALSSSIGGVLNGFQAYEGALGLIGVESEEVQKTLLKVQSAMALSQGLQGLGEAKDSFIQLGAVVKNAFNGMTTASKAFAITGIGLLLVSLGTVIAYWDDISKAIGVTTDEQEKYAQKQKRINEQSKEARETIAKESGAFATLISRLKETNSGSKERDVLIKQINKEYGTTLKNIKDETKFQEQLNTELASYLEYQKAKYELQKNEDKIVKNLEVQDKLESDIAKGKKEQIALEKELAKAQDDANKGKLTKGSGGISGVGQLNTDLTKAKEKLDENKKALKENEEALKNAKLRFEDYGRSANNASAKVDELTNSGSKYVENNKDVEDSTKKTTEEIDLTKDEAYIAEQERLKELNKAELDSLKVIEDAKKANADMLLTEQELAIQKENEAYQIKLDNALKFGQDTEDLEIEHLNNLNNINLTAQEKQYANEKVAKDKQLALDKETADKKIAIEKSVAEAKLAIQNQSIDVALQGINLIKSLFEKSKGVQKAALVAESAIGIAKIIINTQASNAAATLKYAALPGGLALSASEIALNRVSAGLGIAANVAATAKALQALGGGNAPSGSVGGGGGGGGSQSFTPSFNVVGNSGINQLANLQQQPVKAYITTGEVSTALSLERNTLQKTTF
jgi:hypothetical protein